MNSLIFNSMGIAGVLLCLVAFFLLQIGKINNNQLQYSALNLLGSIGILISLTYQWNLAAFLMEVTWGLLSLYGVIKFYIKRATS
jgi:hypothetical protein